MQEEPVVEKVEPPVIEEPVKVPEPKPKEEPAKKPAPPAKKVFTNEVDCLLVSCSELVPLFTENLKLKCDESFLEESAISSVQKSIHK